MSHNKALKYHYGKLLAAIKKILPIDATEWLKVAHDYQKSSGEKNIRNGEALRIALKRMIDKFPGQQLAHDALQLQEKIDQKIVDLKKNNEKSTVDADESKSKEANKQKNGSSNSKEQKQDYNRNDKKDLKGDISESSSEEDEELPKKKQKKDTSDSEVNHVLLKQKLPSKPAGSPVRVTAKASSERSPQHSMASPTPKGSSHKDTLASEEILEVLKGMRTTMRIMQSVQENNDAKLDRFMSKINTEKSQNSDKSNGSTDDPQNQSQQSLMLTVMNQQSLIQLLQSQMEQMREAQGQHEIAIRELAENMQLLASSAQFVAHER